MRFLFASAVLVTAVVAVSAGIYPVKTGGSSSKGAGHTKGGSGGAKLSDDRFHLQSPDGQYVFGHTTGNQGRAEIRTKDGTVTGYYSYVGDNGQVVYTNYIADKDGYRVVSNTGAPSASVTIEGSKKDGSASEQDFQKIFVDFTKNIKEKIVSKTGQKTVDPSSDGQQQVVVDPIVFPNTETKPSKQEENNVSFPDWNQLKTSTTQKSTNGVKNDEGHQQQEIIKGNDNDGQGSFDIDWNAITTTETISKYTTVAPIQVPINDGQKGGYSGESHNKYNIKEITTEIADFRIGTETTVIDDIENNSPVTKPVSPVNDIQTTISYDGPGQTTEGNITRGDSQISIETDVSAIVKPQNEEPFENVATTENSRFEGQSTVVPEDAIIDYTTTKTRIDNVATMMSYEPRITTFQPTSKIGDTETTTSIQYVTEQNEDGPEFRTLEPTGRIGTTISPDYGQTEAQEQEISWPVIPQEPVPQVLVPLDPYVEVSRSKNAGIKTDPIISRSVRNFNSDEVKPTEIVLETETETSTNVVENATLFDFPKFYVIG